MDWKQIVRDAAPAVGTALFGPAGGAALAFLGERLLGKPEAGEAEIAAAVRGLPPGERLELRRPEADFTARMTALGLDLERLNAQHAQLAGQDRASARERQARLGDRTPQVLAYLYTGAFFLVLGSQLAFGVFDLRLNDKVLRTLDITMGVLFAFVTASKDYFLGSSAGSVRKTELMGRANGAR
jgi:hypothetical protein